MKMKNVSVFMALILLFSSVLFAQVGVNTDNSVPDPSAMLDVKSTTKGFLPPRMTLAERDALVSPAEGLIIYNTTDNKPNYRKNGAWTTFDNPNLVIGGSYNGGKIAYILQPGDPGYIAGEVHGLIAAPNDQSAGAPWGCSGTALGDTAKAIGTGQANTWKIVNNCSSAGIAARICNDLTLNGYRDWYLPSVYELWMLYNNRVAIGGFAEDYYWSSSENNADEALAWYFTGMGYMIHPDKGSSYHVRAVRSF
jgi:hypothetical protein